MKLHQVVPSIFLVPIGFCLLCTASPVFKFGSASAQPVSPIACTAHVLTTEATDDEAQRVVAEAEKSGLKVVHRGQSDFAHADMEIFFSERCAEKAIALGHTLKAKTENVRRAEWKTKSDITVVLPRFGHTVSGVISKYGRFEVEYREAKSSCVLKYRRPGRHAVPLTTVANCFVDTSSSSLKRTDQSFTSSSGEEFHVFSIDETRGGNACSGTDHVVAVVTPQEAWASKEFGGACATEEAVSYQLKEQDGSASILSVVYAADDSRPAKKFDVSKGHLGMSDVARTLVRAHKETIRGLFSLGHHTFSTITPEGSEGIAIQEFKCKGYMEAHNRLVSMVVENKSWDDGTVQTVCVDVTILDK